MAVKNSLIQCCTVHTDLVRVRRAQSMSTVEWVLRLGDCKCGAVAVVLNCGDALDCGLQNPEVLKLKEEMSRISQKIRNCEKDLEKKKEDKRKQGSQIENLQRTLQDVTQSMNELIAQQEREGGGRLQLAESQMMEYHRM